MGLLRSLVSSRRGSIHLDGLRELFELGDAVDVTATLTAKQDLGPGRYFASLVCFEEIRSVRISRAYWLDHRFLRFELWRTEVELANNEVFSAGTEDTRNVVLQLPFEMPEWAPGADGAFSALRDRQRRFAWEVGVHLDLRRSVLERRRPISVIGAE